MIVQGLRCWTGRLPFALFCTVLALSKAGTWSGEARTSYSAVHSTSLSSGRKLSRESRSRTPGVPSFFGDWYWRRGGGRSETSAVHDVRRSRGGKQVAVNPEDSDADEVEALVIGPGSTQRSAARLQQVSTNDDMKLKAYSAGSGDDDDEGGDSGDDEEGAWSYFDEVDMEDEPEWVAAYAALEDSVPDAADGGTVRTAHEARAILRDAWARAVVSSETLARDKQGDDGDDEAPPLPFTRQSKAAARRELYKAFTADLKTGSRTMGGRHWLDRDSLVHLRGLALLCQRPEYADLLAGLASRYSRGARLVVPTATHSMQEVLAMALAHSVSAGLIVADHKRIAAVRRVALEAGVPKRLLGADMVLGSLLDLARDGDERADGDGEGDMRPLVVFLADKGRPFLQSKAVADALQRELQSKVSKTFFLLSSELDPDSELPGIQIPPTTMPMGTAGGVVMGPPEFVTPNISSGGGDLPGRSETGQFPSMLNGLPPMPPGMMPWAMPGARPPNFKGGPILHVVIRPNPMMAQGGGNGVNGTGANGGMPFPISPAQLSPLFKKSIAELAEHFSELAKERMAEQGTGGGVGKGQGDDEDDKDEDDGDDDEESEEFKDRAAQESTALAHISNLLEALSKDENFQRMLRDGMAQAMSPSPDGQPMHPMMMPGLHITFALPPLPGRTGQMPPAPPQTPQQQQSQIQQPGQGSTPVRPGATVTIPPQLTHAPNGGSLPSFASLRNPWSMFHKNRGSDDGSVQEEGEGGGGEGASSQRIPRRRKSRASARARSEGGNGKDSVPADQPLSAAEAEDLFQLFEEVVIAPTKDAALRARWDKLMQDDQERHNAKCNLALITAGLHGHHLLCPDLTRSHPLLYKVQLKGGADVAKVIMTAVEVDVSQGPLPHISMEDGVYRLLSVGALETAMAMVCKTNVPRPGMPVLRTREEVASLAQNRHEHALVANVIMPQDIGVTYSMIGGLSDVKETLRQCVTYPLKFPHLYSEGLAADSVKGVLLFGPPGTGKTMLAKAVATEGGATFLTVDASVIESKWLGESEKNAKAVFTLARRLAPCVIYLDEVDSILSSRDQGEDTKYNTITSVKTTFMQEWDGLRTTSDRVIVVASTNRPYALDQAVLRRMPRRILVDLPDQQTREDMLRVIMTNNRMAPDVNLTTVAKKLEGYTGSDIKEVCREAVVRIAHEESQKLDQGPGVEFDALGKRLRPVKNEDFVAALEKLSASVAAKGRELERVREWNNQFGEVRKKQRAPHLSMYL